MQISKININLDRFIMFGFLITGLILHDWLWLAAAAVLAIPDNWNP